jgi:hypothetical protein
MVYWVKISKKVPMGASPKMNTYPDIRHFVFFTKLMSQKLFKLQKSKLARMFIE